IMETKVLAVSDAKEYYTGATAKKPKRCPVVRLQGDWLSGIGFTCGKLAAAEYGPGRIILRLRDSGSYKDLVKGALKTNSGLFQVQRETNNKLEFPRIDIRGFRLKQIGFTIGSVMIARYEYGLIKLLLVDLDLLEERQESLSMETKSLVVTRAKSSVVNKYRPKIVLTGGWLTKIGFTAGKLVAAEYGQGQIIMRLQDSEPRQDLGKGALRASSGLFQVKTTGKSKFPFIDIKGFWLEQFGFTIGKAFTVCYEFGFLRLSVIGQAEEDGAWKQEC
ncbi:MAG: hypothetical protein K6U80_19760, partial [Firmicutes bacterium]|nr:hypothetical protein [Bacillota bacterium]